MNAYIVQDENIPMGTSASAVSSLTGKCNLDENRWNSSQRESFFLWLLLLSLVQIRMQHTLFLLVLCFALNPVNWATCRMTKLADRTVFFKGVDFG